MTTKFTALDYAECYASGLIARDEYEALMRRYYPNEPTISEEDHEKVVAAFMERERPTN